MHKLKHMKETLVGIVEAQLANVDCVDTKELGEAIDMIKDLEQAMYYCSIVKAMKKAEEEEEMLSKECHHHYYSMPYPHDRDMDKDIGRMYYSEGPRDSQGRFTEKYYPRRMAPTTYDMGGETAYYHEKEFPFELRDVREGRSPMSRRMYMESKEMHKDKEHKVKELEKYMKELSEDIVEMIQDASPEEKQMLEKKMTQLTSKISQLG